MSDDLSIEFAGGSDIGRHRDHNEDRIFLAHYAHSDVYLFAVADGVGGHKGGEVASQMVIDSLDKSIQSAVLQAHSGGGYSEHWLEHTLDAAIQEANQQVIQQQQNTELENMATTLVVMLVKANQYQLSHLGDSRCYESTAAALRQLTEDHTVLRQMLNRGEINLQQYEMLPYHNMISNAIGLTQPAEIETQAGRLETGSIYLLCSDGLTNCVEDETIQIVLHQQQELDLCVDKLITQANDGGGIDNISVVLFRLS